MATTDALQTWMKDYDIWHEGLHGIFKEEEIETLADFKDLPKLDVIYIIDDAKELGFENVNKLKQLHGGIGGFSGNKNKVKRSHTMHSITVPTGEAINNENSSTNIHKKASSTTKRKRAKTTNLSAKKLKDSQTFKAESRQKMEAYLRKEGIWQIDVFDIITDEYKIYEPDELEQYKKNKPWAQQFISRAKQRGLMSHQAKNLEIYFGIKKRKRNNKSMLPVKKNKKTEKRKAKSAMFIPEIKARDDDPKEVQKIARDAMEPFMKKHGFWQKDLFLVLLEYDVCSPEDFDHLSKAERKTILKAAKRKGFMGQKVKHFKAYFT
eukprot:146673_1